MAKNPTMKIGYLELPSDLVAEIDALRERHVLVVPTRMATIIQLIRRGLEATTPAIGIPPDEPDTTPAETPAEEPETSLESDLLVSAENVEFAKLQRPKSDWTVYLATLVSKPSIVEQLTWAPSSKRLFELADGDELVPFHSDLFRHLDAIIAEQKPGLTRSECMARLFEIARKKKAKPE